MGIIRLAVLNFKSGFKNYLSLVLSLAFTVLVFLNFQNILCSDAFEELGTRNREYINMLVQMTSFILGCFMVFFIWYSTNVFLTRRKKEIGIYVFMGLSNQKIGRLYLAEIILIGFSALGVGLVLGMLVSGLFQMILFAISDLAVEIRFWPSLKPALVTGGVYLAIYMVFAGKGYVNIVRSSVLEMISAAKQNEYVRQKYPALLIKAVFGTGTLTYGYALAMKEGRANVMGNALGAVILVTVGVYLLFGGLIPLIFQTLAGRKLFLYGGGHTLWINSMIFRIKKNYRTYAMVSVLMLCSVTALAMGFAMKGRYDNIVQFENTYTFQLLSTWTEMDKKAREQIEKESPILLSSQIPILSLDPSLVKTEDFYSRHAFVAYSSLRRLALDTGLEMDFPEPGEDEVYKISHLYLLSLITEHNNIKVEINGKTYSQTGDSAVPYLGYLQESMSFYVLNDREYELLRPLGEELTAYNYRIGDEDRFMQARENLDVLVEDTKEYHTIRVAIDPKSNEIDWIKVLYSICIFMFLVFILASGSILFMKVYNDAFEEKERYGILKKMGIDKKILRRSAAMELMAAYGLSFLVMGISSLFSVGALGKMMFTSLLEVNLISVLVVFVILAVWYFLSLQAYERNAGIDG
jgi:putative ABC transport system permease protein